MCTLNRMKQRRGLFTSQYDISMTQSGISQSLSVLCMSNCTIGSVLAYITRKMVTIARSMQPYQETAAVCLIHVHQNALDSNIEMHRSLLERKGGYQ